MKIIAKLLFLDSFSVSVHPIIISIANKKIKLI